MLIGNSSKNLKSYNEFIVINNTQNSRVILPTKTDGTQKNFSEVFKDAIKYIRIIYK